MTTITEDARMLKQLRTVAERAASEAERWKDEYKAAERKFFERLADEEVGSIKVDGVSFVPARTTYGQIQDREAFVAWALENEPTLIEQKERTGLINEMVREHLDTGTPLPPGLGFYVKEYVSQRVAS